MRYTVILECEDEDTGVVADVLEEALRTTADFITMVTIVEGDLQEENSKLLSNLLCEISEVDSQLSGKLTG